MKDSDFAELEQFLKEYNSTFTSFDSIDPETLGRMDILSHMLRSVYFMRRKIIAPKK